MEQAYEAAYLWLFHIDQAPTEVAEKPPEMVELYSTELISWVRAGVEVQQRAIIALVSINDERKKVIFSAAGYSPGAISIGESQGVALFTLRADGSARPETGHAIMMMPNEVPPAPFAFQLVDEEAEADMKSAAGWGTTKFDSNVWVDCPECGTNQHVSLKSCRVCGTKLVAEPVSPLAPAAHQYQCRNCGSHDIEVLKPTAAPDERDEPQAGVGDHDKFDSRR